MEFGYKRLRKKFIILFDCLSRVHARIVAVLVRRDQFFLNDFLIFLDSGGYFLAGRTMHFIPVIKIRILLLDLI